MKLEIKQISKTYQNNLKALDNVSLTLTTGMFGLLGPNGAGKSTLMRILSTLIAPDSGEIYLNDENVTDKPWKIKSILGYLPQEFGVYPKTTAIELLTHIAVLKGIVNKRREIAGQLLHMVNLYEHRNRYVYDFSGGMRQRFGIAQALMGDPKILIVDEPTAGLDPTERNRFQNILADVAKERIVLFSTHIVQDISDLCNKMAVLHKGRVKFEGSPADALKLIENKVYEKRWQIELLFKQLKHNFPLKFFLGDNENAIKIQIWCILIVNLLMTIIKKVVKRRWAFSNLVSFCRLHLFNYIHLIKFLENPEKDWIKENQPPNCQLHLKFDNT